MDFGMSSHVNSHVNSHSPAGVNSGVKNSPPLIGGLFTLISLPRFFGAARRHGWSIALGSAIGLTAALTLITSVCGVVR